MKMPAFTRQTWRSRANNDWAASLGKLLKRLPVVILLLGMVGEIQAQETITFENLGSGTQDADPALRTATPEKDAPSPLIRDVDNGTWWRGRIHGATKRPVDALPLVLAFKGAYAAHLTLRQPQDGWQVHRSRWLAPGPPWSTRLDLVVVLPESLRSGEPFYLHIKDGSHRRVRAEILPLDVYLEGVKDRRDVAIACATALITLALLAAVLVHSTGEKAYAHLSAMACMAAGYILGLTGVLFDLIPLEELALIGIHLQRMFAMWAMAFSHFFIIAFLSLRARRPIAARLLAGLAWSQIAISILGWLEGLHPAFWGATLSNLLIVASTPIVLWEAWFAHRQGLRAGRFVLFAWAPALLLMVVWIFALQDWLPRAAVDLGSLISWALVAQVAILAFGLSEVSSRLRNERDRATREAELDALTGLLNRRALERRLKRLLAASANKSRFLSVIYLDLDHFKRMNDTHGHAGGDQCLLQLVEHLKSRHRPGDLLARIGGEEFVLVLPGLDGPTAAARAEDLRRSLSSETFRVDGKAIALTCSFGVAAFLQGEPLESLMERADKALYRAKAAGRNQVILDHPDPESGFSDASGLV